MDTPCSNNDPPNNEKCLRKGKAIGIKKGVGVGLFIAKKRITSITDADELRSRVRKSKGDIFRKLEITRFPFRLDRVGNTRLRAWLNENNIRSV
jgi:hypothetical protein